MRQALHSPLEFYTYPADFNIVSKDYQEELS